MNPELVRVLLVEGTSWFAQLIKRVTCSKWSHAAFLFGDTVYEADSGGVSCRPLSVYPYTFEARFIRRLTPAQAQKLVAWCTRRLGAPYDYLAIAGFAVSLLLHLTAVRPLLNSRRAWFCAEFVAAGLEHIVIPLRVASTHTTPAVLAEEPMLC